MLRMQPGANVDADARVGVAVGMGVDVGVGVGVVTGVFVGVVTGVFVGVGVAVGVDDAEPPSSASNLPVRSVISVCSDSISCCIVPCCVCSVAICSCCALDWASR